MDDNEPKDKVADDCGDEVAAVAAESQRHTLPDPYPAEYERARISRSFGNNEHAGHRGRLRDSAKHDDLYGFSDIELVELLLSFFIPQKDTNVVAHRLLDKFGSVAGVLCAPKDELIKLSNMTAQAASMLAALFEMCLASGKKELTFFNRAEAADFFGLAYLGKPEVGTYAAFMDGGLNVRAIECFSADGVPARDILSSACKHRCKYAFIARREIDMFPQTFNIAAEVWDLAGMLTDMGVTMLDYIIFTDYGYYTIGMPPHGHGWYPLYIFVPAIKYMRSPDLRGNILLPDEHAVYAGRETAAPLDDFARQLCAVIKNEPAA